MSTFSLFIIQFSWRACVAFQWDENDFTILYITLVSSFQSIVLTQYHLQEVSSILFLMAFYTRLALVLWEWNSNDLLLALHHPVSQGVGCVPLRCTLFWNETSCGLECVSRFMWQFCTQTASLDWELAVSLAQVWSQRVKPCSWKPYITLYVANLPFSLCVSLLCKFFSVIKLLLNKTGL